jgi:hypothetical protein
MDATTAVAIAGIVVAGFVGPSVAASWAGRTQGRQHEHERALHDLAELRSVFDDAANNFMRASVALTQALSEVGVARLHPPAGADQPTLETLVRETYDRIQEAQAAGERIEIRVGSDAPVSQAYGHAFAALYHGAKRMFQGQTDHDRQRGTELLDKANTERRRFVAETRSLVGTNLPTLRDTPQVTKRSES